MNTILESTTVLCNRCRQSHPANIERDGACVIGRVTCPQGERRVALSSDAELFTTLRARSRPPSANGHRPRLLNLLPVTQHCNFRCPVCYADAGPQATPSFLAVDQAVARMAEAKQRGARIVSLTGGEATLHPELPAIIRRGRQLGLRVFLVTNGARLAQEADYACILKQAGLARVSVQFDTLNPATHRRLRGNDGVADKQRAAHNIIAAGLRLGLIATVTRHNLPELGAVIAFGLSLAPALGSITLQAVTPTGRYELDNDATVDKEQIVAQVLAAGATLDDVWPLPHFAPWGMALHPDCGVNVIALTGNGRLRFLRELVDVPGLHRRLSETGDARGWITRNLTPLRHLLASARPGRRLELGAHLTGFLRGRGRRGMVVIGIGAFCQRDFLDEARLAGCATDELTANGGVSPCLLYSGRARPPGAPLGPRKETTSARPAVAPYLSEVA